MSSSQLILFSDLDGTLLDHHSYSWQPARSALQQLQQQGIPLILCTSKTAAEVAELHRELQLATPYIVENGAAVILDPTDQSAHFFGTPYLELTALVQQLRSAAGYRFRGFADFSVAELMRETGLQEAQARRAMQRLCSEPLRWEDSPERLAQFRRQLAEHGLQLLRGGRFYHVLSNRADKGLALRWLLEHYPGGAPAGGWRSVALGDGPNDQSMLEAADLAVVIPSASGLSPDPRNVTKIAAQQPGPAGWNSTVLSILSLQQQGASYG